jgi:hypothetical protein
VRPPPPPPPLAYDHKTYALEWTVLLVAILGWATTFCLDVAKQATFESIWTPAFLGSHLAQLFTYITSVVAAKRIK